MDVNWTIVLDLISNEIASPMSLEDALSSMLALRGEMDIIITALEEDLAREALAAEGTEG